MPKVLVFLFAMFFVAAAHAAPDVKGPVVEKTPELKVPEPVMQQPVRTKPTVELGKEPIVLAEETHPWTVMVHYSPLDLILPNKLGASVAHQDTAASMWEFEYTHGSFAPFIIDDLGKFTEERFSVLYRITGEKAHGFQWYYGAFYHRFKLEIGRGMLNRLSNGSYPSADVVSIGGLGMTIGAGYRWIIKERFVVSLDGAAWTQPLMTTNREARFLDVVTDSGDRDKIEKAMRVMEYFPRFAVLKIAIGTNF